MDVIYSSLYPDLSTEQSFDLSDGKESCPQYTANNIACTQSNLVSSQCSVDCGYQVKTTECLPDGQWSSPSAFICQQHLGNLYNRLIIIICTEVCFVQFLLKQIF